ncbi:MAG: DASH family cryptochrome [Gammaproteobacteria bacterium]|nr:DASH family cryptochrome [Gammaproteobacteria bacterium]
MSNMPKKVAFWFTDDLRLQDNLALNWACNHYASIAFIYVINPHDLGPHNYQHKAIGAHRMRFIYQSLFDLEQQLKSLGHRLVILEGQAVNEVCRFVAEQQIDAVVRSKPVGWYEQKTWQMIEETLPQVRCFSTWNHTLFKPEQLELTQQRLNSFSSFRKHVEYHKIAVQPVGDALSTLPKPIKVPYSQGLSLQDFAQKYAKPSTASSPFKGGEHHAMAHVQEYFSSAAASSYKLTRNQLDGWDSSTKFSPFLALGNLSPRYLWQQLKAYEAQHGANDSTYWIGFELLWREYFQWAALQQQARLFSFQGQAKHKPKTSYYSARFKKWCNGETPYPLVNACMKELNATGFMSNRGRQIVASCLVNELAVDWRYGAAYFQQQLLDYDVACNWGNWQYVAGVGKDPRGGRHFNLDKQTQEYDPERRYIKHWQCDTKPQPLDVVDYVDWPIMPE